MPDIRNTEKFRQFAAELRKQCAEQDVTLMAGKAADLLAAQIEQLAEEHGETAQEVLDKYLTPAAIPTFVEAIVKALTISREVGDTVEPITLDVTGAGRAIAALGMIMKLTAEELGRPGNHSDALSVAADGASAIFGLGAILRDAEPGEPLSLGGPDLVRARRVLHRAIEHLGDGTWRCPCDEPHVIDEFCRLQTGIVRELGILGGWAGGFHEPPADQR
ncbi:hypothetical protein [Actinoplanes awajinensis]|uniref:Uncharacterized protein n=1 Tax=Actinoplanes awajinensis subsp. mycoplanecinus TaxID=135947 RepID=A0A0X3VB78_9ACTN|nr:hypothetical protein [Actinoplanes awajinensis]KUL42063.1 hypothetical protein ADL15_02195 [Actinoplanes awajinensis subsp. mycoplanecinus]